MTQPTQVFPPWLTPSVSVVTNAVGTPVATDTSIVFLPLTYFGPSIPLGSLWTFGGSTSPASTPVASTPLTTTAIPSLTTTATPTTSLSTSLSTSASTSASISSSNTATSISSITPTSSASSTNSSLSLTPATTPSAIPASTSSAAQLSVLTKGQLIGVIVASILGLIFLFVLALFLFLWCKGRRNRQFTTLVPQDEDRDYYVLSPSDVEGYNPEDHRAPGEGSPRHSGDEASPFLRQSRAGGPSLAETSAAGAATSASMSQEPTEMGVSHATPRAPPVTTTTSHSSGSQSSNSHASGFGVLIDRPNQGLGYLPSMPEHPQGSGSPLSAADLHRLDQENENDDSDLYQDGEYSGAYAYATDSLLVPPRLLNPDHSPINAEFPSHISDLSEAEVLTAKRRTMSSLIGSKTTPEIPDLPDFGGEPSPRKSGLLGAIGLGLSGLTNLGRRSWFKSSEFHRQSPDFTIEPFAEKDPEMDVGMLSPDSIVDSRGRRVGTGPDGARPISSSSVRTGTSGGTIYHDVQSSVPSTPLLPPLPRAVTPASASAPAVGNQPATERPWLPSPLSGLPAYTDEDNADSLPNADHLDLGLNFDPNSADILDIPAPAALPHFSSVSSLKETNTGSSLGLKMLSFPPGLDTIKPVSWSDVATEVVDSDAAKSTLGGAFLNNSLSSSGRVTIDLLEDAPPSAELGWRSIASAGFGDAGRRGTFGLFIDQSGFISEQGSLHSMRSHFNPSVRSTGSAPASRRDGSNSMGSASSRPSAYSLARTGSVSSDGRRRHHPNSPTLSAFGYSPMRPSLLSNNKFEEPSTKLPHNKIASPLSALITPDQTSTIRSLGSSGSAAVTVVDDTSFGTVKGPVGLVRSGSTSQMSSASFPLNTPWAAGLDSDWVPAA